MSSSRICWPEISAMSGQSWLVVMGWLLTIAAMGEIGRDCFVVDLAVDSGAEHPDKLSISDEMARAERMSRDGGFGVEWGEIWVCVWGLGIGFFEPGMRGVNLLMGGAYREWPMCVSVLCDFFREMI